MADARAQLDLEQRADAYRINRRSRLIAQALRVTAALAGFVLVLMACLELWGASQTRGVFDLRVAGIASAGVGLFVGALRANPPDLKPSTSEFDAVDSVEEPAPSDSGRGVHTWLDRLRRLPLSPRRHQSSSSTQ